MISYPYDDDCNIWLQKEEEPRPPSPEAWLHLQRTFSRVRASKATQSKARQQKETQIHKIAAFVCPLTLQILRDPVVGADGHTYERDAICDWLNQNGTSPLTRQRMQVSDLVPNISLLQAMKEVHQGPKSEHEPLSPTEFMVECLAQKPSHTGKSLWRVSHHEWEVHVDQHRLRIEILGSDEEDEDNRSSLSFRVQTPIAPQRPARSARLLRRALQWNQELQIILPGISLALQDKDRLVLTGVFDWQQASRMDHLLMRFTSAADKALQELNN